MEIRIDEDTCGRVATHTEPTTVIRVARVRCARKT